MSNLPAMAHNFLPLKSNVSFSRNIPSMHFPVSVATFCDRNSAASFTHEYPAGLLFAREIYLCRRPQATTIVDGTAPALLRASSALFYIEIHRWDERTSGIAHTRNSAFENRSAATPLAWPTNWSFAELLQRFRDCNNIDWLVVVRTCRGQISAGWIFLFERAKIINGRFFDTLQQDILKNWFKKKLLFHPPIWDEIVFGVFLKVYLVFYSN